MAQAVSRRPLTAEARAQSRFSLCEICGGRSTTGKGLSSSTSVFPCQHHSTNAPYSFIYRQRCVILGQGRSASNLEVSDVPGVWRECDFNQQQETYPGGHTDSANL